MLGTGPSQLRSHCAFCYAPRVQSALDEPLSARVDALLVADIAAGQERARAEAELFRRYQRRVYLYGLKHLRDTAAAADLVQDVIATVIEKARAGEVREAEKLASFVLGTCRMLVVNRARGEARRRKLLAQYADPRQEQAPELPAASSGELARVGQCLEALADRDRAVLLLSFYAELDAGKIAAELGLNAGHVRVIRHRALERMQGCMNAAWEDA